MIASFFVLPETPKYAINRIKKVSDSVSDFKVCITYLIKYNYLLYINLNHLTT